jgi:hypothetical protein
MLRNLLLVFASVLTASPVRAQMPTDPGPRIAAQKEALSKLAAIDGVWRGEAVMISPSGKHTLTQTERVGPFLDGAVRVMEGRGYEPDGRVSFNAFGIVSYDPDKKTYSLRSYTQGRTGDFPLSVTADGFTWEIPAGPMTIRYVATIKEGTWHEVGDRVAGAGEPVRFFEMTLKRVGDTDWPAGTPVPPK